MDNRADFTVDSSIFQEAIDALTRLMPRYQTSVSRIRNVTESLLDTSNWKGKARDEFKDTYYIVGHYLDDDTAQISSIKDIIQGFKDIYNALDVDLAKDLHDKVTEAAESVRNL